MQRRIVTSPPPPRRSPARWRCPPPQVKPDATVGGRRRLRPAPTATQKLLEGAKKEGALTIYTSAQSDDMGALVPAFEKKYGIKVSVWRSSSEKVLQRAVQEARANRNTMDIAETNGPELESLHREKILQAGEVAVPRRPHPARRSARTASGSARASTSSCRRTTRSR